MSSSLLREKCAQAGSVLRTLVAYERRLPTTLDNRNGLEEESQTSLSASENAIPTLAQLTPKEMQRTPI